MLNERVSISLASCCFIRLSIFFLIFFFLFQTNLNSRQDRANREFDKQMCNQFAFNAQPIKSRWLSEVNESPLITIWRFLNPNWNSRYFIYALLSGHKQSVQFGVIQIGQQLIITNIYLLQLQQNFYQNLNLKFKYTFLGNTKKNLYVLYRFTFRNERKCFFFVICSIWYFFFWFLMQILFTSNIDLIYGLKKGTYSKWIENMV